MEAAAASASERNKAPMPMPMLHSHDVIRRAPLIQRSGPLYANTNHEFVFKPPQNPHMFDAKNMHHRVKGWARRLWSFLLPFIPGVVNPDAKVVQHWNKLLIISCLFALLLDPFFFFLLYVQENNKCIILNWPMATTLIVLRSMNDLIYLLHILLQFRLAYVASGNRSGELIEDPKMIARNYLSGRFIIDFFVVLPLSQIIIIMILRDPIGSGASHIKILVRLAVLVQLIPRLHRILTSVVGSSPTSFIFESAWSNVVMNLLTFVLASHVVGSCWYLFALQRVSQCFRDACRDSNITRCMEFINCRHGNGNNGDVSAWKNNENASACFGKDGFNFGIYETAVNLTTQKSIGTRYAYSMFWGFQQISTLAGNQVPSYFVWEVVFTTVITGLGLLLFALLIGNVQNFLQALGRRRVEMYVRRRDVEQWMTHRRLPEELRSNIRNCERFNNSDVASVVNEKDVMEYLPEDLQLQIRRHLFKYVEFVRIFQLMDKPIVNAIRERLKTQTYIQGSTILHRNSVVDKMVFIISGKMVSIMEDKVSSPLTEGDVCGEELLTWILEHSSVNKDGNRIMIRGRPLFANRIVSCLTNVEAFVLYASDLEEVMSLYARFLRNPRIQGALRYESPYWRGLAARRIQIAWRLGLGRRNRADLSPKCMETQKETT